MKNTIINPSLRLTHGISKIVDEKLRFWVKVLNG
jgi:hypothetical protein